MHWMRFQPASRLSHTLLARPLPPFLSRTELPPVEQLRGRVEQVVESRRRESADLADKMRALQAAVSLRRLPA